MKQPIPVETSIPAEARAKLTAFVELLLAWNGRINLVGRSDRESLWTRHVLDSAQLAPLLPVCTNAVVDLGSGAGFPGLVLALVTERHVTLIESDRRKAAFLREATRSLGANAHVLCGRIEDARLPPACVVTARALAPLDRLLGLASPLLAPDGTALFLKGASVQDELTQARANWTMTVETFASATDAAACILRLSNIRRAHPC